jgi:hypothetical protein
VAAKCSRLLCICRTYGRPVELALELMISSFGSRASVVPALIEWVSNPLIGNHTLRGLGFSSVGLGLLRGSRSQGEGPGHLTPTVVAGAVRCGRTFSGMRPRVVGDVGRQM